MPAEHLLFRGATGSGAGSTRRAGRSPRPGLPGRLAFAAALACLASSSSAASWVHFFDCGSADDQVRHYSYDPSSLRRSGKYLLVSLDGDYSGVKGSRSTDARLLWAIDCKGRTFYEKSRIEYDSGRHVVWRHNRPTSIMDVRPPGIAQRLYDRVCS